MGRIPEEMRRQMDHKVLEKVFGRKLSDEKVDLYRKVRLAISQARYGVRDAHKNLVYISWETVREYDRLQFYKVERADWKSYRLKHLLDL